ncbi:HAMP domain-containing sensor histidine kinase [Desulfobacterales bacterium HSG17]|nr:HAMP domain-containing sensor histidine kinase [Desulfobacterales bacterium HSG17]
MKSRRSIIIFWALFLMPTLIIAGIALKLLSHEQERINQSAISALSQRAEAVSQTIHITIEDVLENLKQSLLAIEQEKLETTLLIWEGTNPLVRNIFIYNNQTLEYPAKGMESTLEERRFIARYEPLFSGRVKFDFNTAPAKDFGTASAKELQKLKGIGAAYPKTAKYDSISEKQTISSRQKLVALSKAPGIGQKISSLNELKQNSTSKSGWIPWFSENRLHILGWVKNSEKGSIYGIELELMTLLSRLVLDFPEILNPGAALVLMDGNGNLMHQTGTMEVNPDKKPVKLIHVSNLLPHWYIGIFIDAKGFGTTKGFLYISILLLAIFIVAIISGGILLTRLTLANMKDARQKTSFVSSVSHELKTPLTSIRMYAELLLSKRVKNEDKIQTYLSTIVNESSRLTRLINNILDFGKLEHGNKKYHLEIFELDRFLEHTINTHNIRIESQGLEIKTLIKKENYKIKTDKDALEQVILNLLDNALKYAGQGKFIKFVLKKENSSIVFKICDDGPGIPKEQQSKIFEKFHRIDNSLTSQQPGSGLGLSIAQQIIKDLGGKLYFKPVSPNGSCFIIRINNYDPS